MSSISQPLSLLNHTHFTISGFRSRNSRISHFQHHCLPIEVASLNQSFRPVAHLYPGSENLVSRPGIWNRRRLVVLMKHGGLEGTEDADRNVDFLVRFLENVFKQISKRARKAVRSVLPVSIPTELVCFSVDGVTILAFLWLAKAFVEVVCTVGSVALISILLIPGICYGIFYIQESRTNSMNVLSGEHWWSSTQSLDVNYLTNYHYNSLEHPNSHISFMPLNNIRLPIAKRQLASLTMLLLLVTSSLMGR